MLDISIEFRVNIKRENILYIEDEDYQIASTIVIGKMIRFHSRFFFFYVRRSFLFALFLLRKKILYDK